MYTSLSPRTRTPSRRQMYGQAPAGSSDGPNPRIFVPLTGFLAKGFYVAGWSAQRSGASCRSVLCGLGRLEKFSSGNDVYAAGARLGMHRLTNLLLGFSI